LIHNKKQAAYADQSTGEFSQNSPLPVFVYSHSFLD